MYTKFSKLLLVSLLTLSMGLAFVSCKESDPILETLVAPTFEVPGTYYIQKASKLYVTLNIKEGAVKEGDAFSIQTGNGTFVTCPITAYDAQSVTFEFPSYLEDGSYTLYYRPAGTSDRKNVGTIAFYVQEVTFTPSEGTTVYGTVKEADNPVAGVVISDGFLTTVTNERGEFELQSDKQLGYVFMSVPSGYEPERSGILPKMYQPLRFNDGTPESVSFQLKKVDQSNYKVLFLGDMHLANRTSDISQFKNFTNDVNQYCSENAGSRIYAITLGDMTWDIYWYDNKFTFGNYIDLMNNSLNDLCIYHTIGNHDNDYKAVKSNFDAKKEFRRLMAPNYYSFNIGGVHYIIIDDIDCSNYDGTTSRKYNERVVKEQLDWLAKDLSYVAKSTPVVIMSHAPVFGPSSATTFKYKLENTGDLLKVVADYKVHFVTGHTHKNYNVVPTHACTQGLDIHEHNVAAVCGSWWWSGHLTSGVHLSQDGAPGGYAIWDVKDAKFEYVYKATGKPVDYQFRAYDLNCVHFGDEDVPNLNKGTKAYSDWNTIIAAYSGAPKNHVLLNIWNYNPKWTISVTDENGKSFSATPIMAYDPLHIAAMSVKRYNSASVTTSPNFVTSSYPHFFRVVTDDPNADLTITVKDEFGHTWIEKMERPKQFSIEAYK